MKTLITILLLFSLSVFGQNETLNYNFPKIKSSVTMPIRIPLSEISDVVNASVKDLIFEDSSFDDNNSDQFKVKVWKTRPIRFVSGVNQNLLIEVPLKIWAQKGIGTLGMYSYQETTFQTVMYFNTQIFLNKNWTVTTNTSSNGFKWIAKPVLDFGPVKIPITPMVEKSLRAEQAKFCKTIDDMMATQLNFQNYALLAWNQFSQPFHINEEFNTWLKITPLYVNITPLKFYRNEIQGTIGIDIYSETFTGQKPESAIPVAKISDFSTIPMLDNKFVLQTTANIPFSDATSIAQQLFLNKEFDFREGKSKIKINAIDVSGKDGKTLIKIQTEGAINGTSVISGIPVYNASIKKIVFTDTKFQLKTKNVLYKTAVILFQRKIIEMIEEDYGIPTNEIENEAVKGIEKAFNTEYYKGLKLSGKVIRLKPSNIIVTDDYLTAVIDTEAMMAMKIQGM